MMSQSQVTHLDIEEEPLHRKQNQTRIKKRRCLIAVGVVLLALFLLFVVALILALTVFKVRDIQTKLVSATVEGVSPSVSIPAIVIKLNITLNLQISVNNNNYASFRHDQGKSYLLYEGIQVGDAAIDPGLIPSRGSTTIQYRLTLQVDELAGKANKLFRDVMDGELVMQAQTRITGKVRLLGIFRRNAVALSNCELAMNVIEMKLKRQVCKQTTKM